MDTKPIWMSLHAFVVLIGGAIGWYLGDYTDFFYCLLAFVIVDYMTGVASAIIHHRLSSKEGFKDIAQKLTIFVLVGAANLLDVYVIGQGDALRDAVICFYLLNEGISLLENAATLGLKIPKRLTQALELTARKNRTTIDVTSEDFPDVPPNQRE